MGTTRRPVDWAALEEAVRRADRANGEPGLIDEPSEPQPNGDDEELAASDTVERGQRFHG
jgi:hypothetical protein